jgi:hypothetical protein
VPQLTLADFDHTTIKHRDGVPWWEAPAPRRFLHRHSAQTTSNYVERCACGAMRFVDDPGGWIPASRSALRVRRMFARSPQP